MKNKKNDHVVSSVVWVIYDSKINSYIGTFVSYERAKTEAQAYVYRTYDPYGTESTLPGYVSVNKFVLSLT